MVTKGTCSIAVNKINKLATFKNRQLTPFTTLKVTGLSVLYGQAGCWAHGFYYCPPPLKKKKPTTHTLTPSRTCPSFNDFEGSSVNCSCLCKGHLQVLGAWGNYIIFSPAYLSKCFMVYSCGEKHFGVGRDLFPFLMFLLGWINTFSRNETFGHVGNMQP